ncbi:MAG: Gfo/Idh/MocA family oxidoreductase [Candidatus Brockarchaeota archaeon]|nr:Gfo/Idh/MocA family oxidoreductase [Candidatus Brockarchaeota archaeon]
MIRVGVIGSGGIFNELHLPYYQMTEKAKVVAVADVNEISAREACQKCGADRWFSDYKELLKLEDVDAVDVCTHPAPHKEIAVAAARAGKHILVEKPMCRTVKEADQMGAAAERAKVVLQVAYMIRFHPTYMKLKQLLDGKKLGDLKMAYSCQVGWFPPTHPWLFVRKQSGGMLVEQAIHTLDEWLWLYGPVEEVYAKVSHVPLGGTYPKPGKAVENNATLIARFRNGGNGILVKSWAAEVGHEGEGVVGSKGSASVDESCLKWKTRGMDGPASFIPEVPDDGTYRTVDPKARKEYYWSYASKGASIEHWLKCIEGKEEPTTSGKVGRAGIEVAEAAYLSSKTGKVVKIKVSGNSGRGAGN